MRKFYINNLEDLNEEEKRTGCVSYARIIKRYIDNLLLCNDIVNIDISILDNLEEYPDEIYQYYLCDLSEYEKEILLDYGIIVSYSDMLDLPVLCVDHFGTRWEYVITEVQWTQNFEEC